MKKQSANRKPAKKNSSAPKSVDEYVARAPEPAISALKKMRATIRSAVPPDAIEIISYGIPAFKHGRVLVWYAAFSNHCSLFPGPWGHGDRLESMGSKIWESGDLCFARRMGGPNYCGVICGAIVSRAFYFLSGFLFWATRALTSFLMSTVGRGLSIGKWMVPFEVEKFFSSFLNFSMTAAVGNRLQ